MSMAMMVAARKQQSGIKLAEGRQPSDDELGRLKSFNSSYETVIEASATINESNGNAEEPQKSLDSVEGDTKLDSSEEHNESKQSEELRCDVGVQVNQEVANEQARRSSNKYLRPIKSFFVLTSQMNPFSTSHGQNCNNNHLESSRDDTNVTARGSKRDKCKSQSYTIIGFPRDNLVDSSYVDDDEVDKSTKPNGHSKSDKSHFSLLTFAQRYFSRRASRNSKYGSNSSSASSPRICQSSTGKTKAYCSVSEPATPIRWTSRNKQLEPSPKHVGSDELTVSNVALSQPEATTGRLSVRFLDDASRAGDEVDENDIIAEEEEEEEEEDLDVGGTDDEDLVSDRSSELVAKLFKFPTTITSTATVDASEGHQDSEQQVQSEVSEGECPMDSGHFRHYGYRLIDYICNYLDTIRDRRVTPLNIEPGYLKSLIETAAPERGEPFPRIMQDFEKHIMCGITHWQHPHFHAYFPAGNAYPSILADMLSDALGCVGFSWAASPAYTELETIMLDWMGKMIGLPDEFLCLSDQDSKGGGVIQGSASECVLVSLLAARHWAMERLRSKYPSTPDGILLSKLIGYCSKEAHSCVEKAAMIGFIRMRALDTDENHSLRGETLSKAIAADLAQGLEPFLVSATLGTTSCISFDNLEELGKVCKLHDIWLHVDAAYAGSALICPEFKYLIKGIDMASSFNMNPNKWMLINFDCSLMWVKDRFRLTRAFVVDPLYLQHSYSDQAIDYRHWGIPLSRRFRALKLWFVIRNYGVQGLQAYIRNHVRLAKQFEQLIRSDSRFTVTNKVVLGLVCFRLIGSNALNQRLLSMINASGKLHMVPASLNGRFIIRFCVCDRDAKDEDIQYAYKCIAEFATELIASVRAGKERIRAISQQNTVEMLASAMPAGVLSPEVESASDYGHSPQMEGQGRSLSVDSSRERSISAIEGRATGESVNVSADEVRTGSARDLPPSSSAESTMRTSSRLSVKSPLTKQRSMLGGEPDLEDDLERRLTSKTEDPENKKAGELEPSEDSHFNNQSEHLAEEQRGNVEKDQQDVLFRLTQRRNRTSGRYKRKFFVRVVSDPRVYRASISGDINAHSSSGSFGTGTTGSIQTPNQSISIPTTQQVQQQ